METQQHVENFNFHYEIQKNADVKKFHELVESLNLQQHVSGATHEHGHLLDLCFTRLNENPILNLQVIGDVISDHFPIIFCLPWAKPTAPRKNIQFRKMKEIDRENLANDIRESNLVQSPPTDVAELVSVYNDTLISFLDKHAPLIEKEIILRVKSPWFTDDIKVANRERRKAEKNGG